MIKFDIVSIGDITFDVFLKPVEAEVHCHLNRPLCELCFNYGDKIEVETIDFEVGGNAANTAIGFSRLGLKTALSVCFGDDDNGKKAIAIVKKEGVDTGLSQRFPGFLTTYSTIVNFQGERTILHHHPEIVHTLKPFPPTSFIYLADVGENFENVFDKVTDFVKKNNVFLVFNPSKKHLRAGVEILRPTLNVCLCLILNLQEARLLLNADPTIEIKILLKRLRALGPKIVVVTDGENGSFAADEKSFYRLETEKADPLEKTGAGDSYSAGFVAALFYKKSIPEAMRWGNLNSASVIGKIGARKGLLSKLEMEEKINKSFLKPIDF